MTAKIGPGHLVLVVGPSGAGKDTLIAGAQVLCRSKSDVVFPRRVVTRAASQAEDNDYVSLEAFDAAARSGAFAFWWDAHNHRYGIPVAAEEALRRGCTAVCNVSRAVVAAQREKYARVTVVMITAPPDVLAQRLSARGRDSDGAIEQRVARNDAFTSFRADVTIENMGPAAHGIAQLVRVIDDD